MKITITNNSAPILLTLKNNCKCLVLEKNEEIVKREGGLPVGRFVTTINTRGYKWDWATCLKCGAQHRINMKEL